MNIPLLKALKRSLSFRAASALGLPIRPMKLRLALTNRCNARCKMCNAWKEPSNRKDELSPEEYARVFSQSEAFLSRARHIALTGGEPSLRKDFEDIIRLCHQRFPGAGINVNTNGFLTGRIAPMAESLAGDGIQITYNISLDGLGETHDQMRGVDGAAKMARATIEALRGIRKSGKRLKIGVNHVMTADNYAECESVHAFCRRESLAFNPIMPMTGELYGNEGDEFAFPPEALRTLARFFEDLVGSGEGDPLAYSEILLQLREERRDFRCWAGQVLVLIEENGDVFPNGGCPRQWVLGNVRETSFDLGRLMRSGQAREALSRVRHCRDCRLACETLTTLKHPEALAARRKMKCLR